MDDREDYLTQRERDDFKSENTDTQRWRLMELRFRLHSAVVRAQKKLWMGMSGIAAETILKDRSRFKNGYS
jgi:hypothetical protein